MTTLETSQFTPDQIEAARRVNRWTADPDRAVWFAGQVHRTRDLWRRWVRERDRYRAECRRRAAGILRDGHLNQPVPEGQPDFRTLYDISGIGPRRIVERVIGVPAAKLEQATARECAKMVLAILEDSRLDRHTHSSWSYRRSLLDSGDWMVVEYEMWIVLPEEPRSPLLADGPDFAKIARDDQIAISATRLLGLHDGVFPQLPRLPDTGDQVFDVCAYASGQQEDGLCLEAMVNLVEPALAAGDGEPRSDRSAAQDQDATILRAYVEAGGNQSAAARDLCHRFGGRWETWRGRVQRALQAVGGSDAVLRAAGIIGSPRGTGDL